MATILMENNPRFSAITLIRGFNFMVKMVKRKCLMCGKTFYKSPADVKRGYGKFCSVSCYKNYHKKIKCICMSCKREFLIRKCDIKKRKFCSSSCSRLWAMAHTHKYKDTSIEIALEKELTRRGIVFQKQYPIYVARTIPDFFISPNICIYADGNFWHSQKINKGRDIAQDVVLNFNGYKVYRFTETEINKSAKKCIDRIKL